ncbi:hypothetical protein [Comamonas guangdongensis]|uniref:Uncharacterized protein n=1 Tax=Comamonas guangdongensis TaxID=510515 RepID=A0ABV3ZXV8_9BURK
MRKINPTAKSANRAYVRLHTYVAKQLDWEVFTKTYRVVLESDFSEEVSLCVVQVFDELGKLASLGPSIPNQIMLSRRKVPAMTVWTECFNDGKSSWRSVSCR